MLISQPGSQISVGPFAFESCNCPQAYAPPRNEPKCMDCSTVQFTTMVLFCEMKPFDSFRKRERKPYFVSEHP